jgi:hypothetical protein
VFRLAGHVISYIRKKLALTSSTSGSRSVGVVRSRTQAMEFFFFISTLINLWSSAFDILYCLTKATLGGDMSYGSIPPVGVSVCNMQ